MDIDVSNPGTNRPDQLIELAGRNALTHDVALDHVAEKSNTPVSKAVVIRLERSAGVRAEDRVVT